MADVLRYCLWCLCISSLQIIDAQIYFPSEDGEEIDIMNLNEWTQPDDIDSGAYDEPFYQNITEMDNEIIQTKTLDLSGKLCARECNGISRICYFKFKIEHYSSMGYACGRCSCSQYSCSYSSECYNKYCITGNGINRNMITVNRRYPGPPIYVCKNDRIIVDVTNMLQGKATSLHWHGMFQKGRPWMDGVAMLSQCPILPGTTFRYDFVASEPGTHYWHEHTGLAKLDGVQGALIVREERYQDPHFRSFDYELPSHILVLTDWKHFMSDDEFPDMKVLPQGKRIQSLLINGKGVQLPSYLRYRFYRYYPLARFEVKSGFSYKFRVVGALCMMCSVELMIQDHSLTVIAVDGNPIQPTTVSSITITSGERYDVIINAFRDIKDYWIHARGIYPCEQTSQVAVLRYKGSTGGSYYVPPPSLLRTINHPNFTIEETKNYMVSKLENRLPSPSYVYDSNSTKFTFVVTARPYTLEEFTQNQAPLFFKPFANSAPFRSAINGISSSMPSVPLYTQFNDIQQSQLCSEECVNGTRSDCQPCVHLIKIPINKTVDFIIADPSNYTGIVHPFHLHGHKFYVLEQGVMNVTVKSLVKRLESGQIKPMRPPAKDTIMVPLGTYAIVRFFTDNPGVWIIHCHYTYHNAVGMHVFLQIGEPQNFPAVPRDYPRCGNYLPTISL